MYNICYYKVKTREDLSGMNNLKRKTYFRMSKKLREKKEDKNKDQASYLYHFQMLDNYKKDPELTAMVDMFDWYVLPSFNPDGYAYTWINDDVIQQPL